MKALFRIAAGLSLCGLSLSAAADVTATLDRDQIAPGETVQLTLQRDGHGGGEPDLGPLKKDFDVLDRSSGSSIQIVNGSLSAQAQMRLTLAPKHAGRIPVPALNWDGEQSPALEVTVADNGAAAQSSGVGSAVAGQGSPHVFLSSSLDQKQPYVQGAVLLTVRIYKDQQFYQANLAFTGNNDIPVQQIGKDRLGSEMRNGHRYDVIERQYLLQPQRSGELSLDGPTLEALVADGGGQDPFGPDPFGNAFSRMMHPTRPLRLHSEAIQLSVRPRPANAAGPDWLPAKNVSLEESWKPDSDSVHAGEPLTLHLRLVATGLSGAQLPDLSTELSLPDGIKAYPDQAKLDTALQSGEVVGSREQDIALIPGRPGHYRIPPLRLAWWDIRQDVQREVLLPERTLEVLPAAGSTGEAAVAAPPTVAPLTGAPAAPSAPAASAAAPAAVKQFPWPWLSLFLGLLWLGTLIVWWRDRAALTQAAPADRAAPPIVPAADAGNLRSAFRQACRDGDPQAARRSLLAWARAHWPQHPPAGLNALAERLHDARLTELLRRLDHACYSGGAWQGEELAQALTALPAPAKPGGKPDLLADLYS
jgi:hypothetical protein